MVISVFDTGNVEIPLSVTFGRVHEGTSVRREIHVALLGGSVRDAFGGTEFSVGNKNITADDNGKFFPVRGYGNFSRSVGPAHFTDSRDGVVHHDIDVHFFGLFAGSHGIDFPVKEETQYIFIRAGKETNRVFGEFRYLFNRLRVV